MSQITDENFTVFTQKIILCRITGSSLYCERSYECFHHNMNKPTTKTMETSITIYVEHVRLTDDTINNKTGVNRQKLNVQ